MSTPPVSWSWQAGRQSAGAWVRCFCMESATTAPFPLGGRRCPLPPWFSVCRSNQTRRDPAGEHPTFSLSEAVSPALLTCCHKYCSNTVQLCFVCVTFALKHSTPQNEYSISTRICTFLYSFLVLWSSSYWWSSSRGSPGGDWMDFVLAAFSQPDLLKQGRPTQVGQATAGQSLMGLAEGECPAASGCLLVNTSRTQEKVVVLLHTSIKLSLVRTTRSIDLNWASVNQEPRWKNALVHRITEKVPAWGTCPGFHHHPHHTQPILLYNLIFSDTTFQHN